MGWYYFEHALATLLGFLVGAAVGHCIAPGDVFLAVVTGIVFALFLQASLARTYGRKWFWPVPRIEHKKDAGTKLTTGHR